MNNLLKTFILTVIAAHQLQADNQDISSKQEAQQPQAAQKNVAIETPKESQNIFDTVFDEFEQSMQKMHDLHKALWEDNHAFHSAFAKAEKKATFPLNIELKEHEDLLAIIFVVGDEKFVLDPQAVDITAKDGELHGVIQVPNGKIHFALNPHQIYAMKQVEIKNEAQKEKDGKETDKFVSYSSSSLQKSFPVRVDLKSIKAEVNKNTLVLSLGKKRHTKIPVTAA